jgi:putative ABC transport system ATP-binding protein
MNNEAILSIDSVSKEYRRGRASVKAVASASVVLNSGEFVIIRGPSGSGKSTLLLMAGGMLRPTSGTVAHADTSIYDYTASERTRWRRSHVGFVFQQIHLLPYLSIRENILVASTGIASSEVDRWLDQLNLADRAAHRPSELSVGEQQRAALIRAIIRRPTLLMADEPISHLDPESSALVVSALDSYRKEGGTVMMVTHHFDNQVADEDSLRHLTMSQGQLLAAETTP